MITLLILVVALLVFGSSGIAPFGAISRKTKRFLLVVGIAYVFVLWSAYRWGKSQRLPDGSIFDHIENERRRKLAQAAQPQPAPQLTAAERLNVGGPTLVAVRYDATHVVFIIGADTQPRFGRANLSAEKVAAPPRPAAQLAALEELFQPDEQSLPEIIKHISVGEQRLLEVSSDLTIPVTLERPVLAATGCSLSAGFLAAVPPDQQVAFSASAKDYFVIRSAPAESFQPPQAAQISELPNWKPSPEFEKQIAPLLAERMRQELSQIDAWLAANAENPERGQDTWVVGSPRSRLARWRGPDERLDRGEGRLAYDWRAFRLTPDGVPRLFARARWQLDGDTVFVMTAWFRADTKPVLLSADSSWSRKIRSGDPDDSAWKNLNFQTVLNEFDADHDGWAELLVYTHDGDSVEIGLYLYTDFGLVPTKTSFLREARPAESCLDPDE
jgi:hypothetical protein